MRPHAIIAIALVVASAASSAFAEAEDTVASARAADRLDKAHVLDGSCVLNIGELRVNITNRGLIGSQYSGGFAYSHAPSAEWPGGSGDEYLWGAGIWIGGRVGGEVTVTTGQLEMELGSGDRIVDTMYEARRGTIERPVSRATPTGRFLPSIDADDDRDGAYDEDMLNGFDDDGDGRVDEDFRQRGDQMFTCTMYDNSLLTREIYSEHRPLDVKVIQRAVAWDRELRENVVGLDYEITNVGNREITDMYLGFFADCDIQNRSSGAVASDDMAGFFSGAVRADDGLYYRAEIAYMWDGAEEDPLPGYFGVQLLDHTTAFDGVSAPFAPRAQTFRIFSTTAAVNQGGVPASDPDRYYVMSRPFKDRNTRETEKADLKVLLSNGPFGPLDVGEKLDFRLALIVGTGLQGMLDAAAEAGKLCAGSWHDEDHDRETGHWGRETLVCLGDYPRSPFGQDPIIGRAMSAMDESCGGGALAIGRRVIGYEDLLTYPDGKRCIWVNMDNCTECLRYAGRECGGEKSFTEKASGRTGIGGRETHYAWALEHDTPPVPPRTRVVSGDSRVEMFWDDRSEFDVDPSLGVVDFESYRVWRVADWIPPGGMADDTPPPARLWGMIDEYDVVNEIPVEINYSLDPLPLGRNTGLEPIVYEPRCLEDERFAGLADAAQELVDSDALGRYTSRPPVRLSDGSVAPGMEGFVLWESYPDVLDTFYAVTARAEDPSLGIVGKRATRYYHYLDTNLHNGFKHCYSVLARDHRVARLEGEYVPVAPGIEEDPANYFQATIPRPDAQTSADRAAEGVNIYVYPNPATREALAEFQARETSSADPTGVRIMFNNLPRAHNTIRIYTVAGDLVETIRHDGHSQGGSATWNLMTRNGQEVVSGVYLYAVHSDEDGFEPFRGRFVVIR